MSQSIKTFSLLTLMLLAAWVSYAFHPNESLADRRTPINLKNMVPTAFGGWREELYMTAQIINPQQKELLKQIYSETLTRTYVNSQGYRVMLSIAYGKNQSDALQLHKPEVCYPAQGFKLISREVGTLSLLGNPTAATRLVTNLGPRFEPVTYWTVVGDHITTGSIDKKLTEMRYGLSGLIPDGMLVRISSVDRSTDKAYAMQEQFATAMLSAITPTLRSRFAGDIPSNMETSKL